MAAGSLWVGGGANKMHHMRAIAQPATRSTPNWWKCRVRVRVGFQGKAASACSGHARHGDRAASAKKGAVRSRSLLLSLALDGHAAGRRATLVGWVKTVCRAVARGSQQAAASSPPCARPFTMRPWPGPTFPPATPQGHRYRNPEAQGGWVVRPHVETHCADGSDGVEVGV